MKFLLTLFVIFALAFGIRAESVCSLPKVIGPCRAAGPSYWYNSASNECEFFLYGGCGGNGNRFPTQGDCEKACKV